MSLRVLLITPEFYGAEKIIKSVLEKSDFEVTWFENRILPLDYHGTNSKLKLLRKIYFLLLSPHVSYLRKELKKIDNTKFDILFSINAHLICPFLFRKLKSKNPKLFSVLYLWDSSSMYNWTKELKQFNKVFTFDRADSIKYQIEYKANFYIKRSINWILEKEYDLFFAGKFSPGRLAVVDKIVKQTEKSGINSFLKLWTAYKVFLHNHLIYRLLKMFNFKSSWIENYEINFEAIEGILTREYIIGKILTYEEMQHHLLCSNVILDLPFKRQSGYTHRLIEALANGKKVITTNSSVRNENFYNSKQIQVIDEQNPEIDCNWIKEKSTYPIDNYFLDLELSTWLKSIVNVGIV